MCDHQTGREADSSSPMSSTPHSPPSASVDKIHHTGVGSSSLFADSSAPGHKPTKFQVRHNRVGGRAGTPSLVSPPPNRLRTVDAVSKPVLQSDLISSRTRRKSAVAAGNPRATVDYGFDKGAPARPGVLATPNSRRRSVLSGPPSLLRLAPRSRGCHGLILLESRPAGR